MKSRKHLGLAAAAAVVFSAAVGPVEAMGGPPDPSLIGYTYIYYADAEMTVELGMAEDQCVTSGSDVIVTQPYIPTPYYTQTATFWCSSLGPILMP